MYEHYIEHGDTDGFLAELKIIASDDQFVSSRALAPVTPSKHRASPGLDGAAASKSQDAATAFKEALEIIKESFGPLEVSALKLASVRRDVYLSNALTFYAETKDIETFKKDLLYVARNIIHETEISMDLV